MMMMMIIAWCMHGGTLAGAGAFGIFSGCPVEGGGLNLSLSGGRISDFGCTFQFEVFAGLAYDYDYTRFQAIQYRNAVVLLAR